VLDFEYDGDSGESRSTEALENATVIMTSSSDDEVEALNPLVVPIMSRNTETIRNALIVEHKRQLRSRLLLQIEAQQQQALDDYHSWHAFVNNTLNHAPRVYVKEDYDELLLFIRPPWRNERLPLRVLISRQIRSPSLAMESPLSTNP
jgi:hypothetical protein